MLTDAHGKPLAPAAPPASEAKPTAEADAKAKAEEPKKDPNALPEGWQFSIDPTGNLVLLVPLAKTHPIVVRGLCDYARTEAVGWYAKQNAARREIQDLVQKGAVRRFVDGIMRRK